MHVLPVRGGDTVTDALIVIGCLALGYFVGWLRGAVKHAKACDSLGAHLLVLADYPHEPETLRRMLKKLGEGLLS